jgi:hypothetical protein
MAGGFVVPFDYDGEPGVVPIFISERDSKGNIVSPDWITKAVVPCADRLRGMARIIVHDVRHVSEITETAVHSLSRKYPNVGDDAKRQLLVWARYNAMDLAAGGRRARGAMRARARQRGYDVPFTPELIDKLAEDPLPELEARDFERSIRRELKDPRLVDMMSLMLQGYSERDAARMLAGEAAGSLRKRFFRRIRTIRPGELGPK